MRALFPIALIVFALGSFAGALPASAADYCTRYGTPIGVTNPYNGGCPSNVPERVDGTILPDNYAYCCMTAARKAEYLAANSGGGFGGPAPRGTSQPTTAQPGGNGSGTPSPGGGTGTPTSGGGTGTPSPTAPQFTTVRLENPLEFDTVEEGLASIMTALRNVVVVLALLMLVIGGIMYILSAGNTTMASRAKATITAALIGLALVIAAPSFLKEIGSILGWGEVNQAEGVAEALTLTQIARNVLNFLLGIIGILAIIMLVIGGITYLGAAGDQTRAQTGKKIVTYAIIGITVAFASLVLVTQVAKFFAP